MGPLLFATMLAPTAFAHGGVNRTVRLTETTLTVEAPADAVLGVLGVPAGEADAHGAALGRWLSEGLAVSVAQVPCALGAAEVAVSRTLSATVSMACPPGDRTLTDHTLASAMPGEQTLVVSEGDVTVLDRLSPAATVGSPAGVLATAATFVWQGAIHLVTGYDHVLFLLCLLAVAGPTAQLHGRGAALRQLMGIVTAFTVGHSLTLSAAALGWVVLPGRWVEVAIAASILLAAGLNLARPDGRASHRPLVAVGFGLIHGFGFSSVLAEVGLPLGQQLVALFSFNAGIELAQLAVVVLAIAPLAWLAQRPAAYRRWVMQAGSAAIGLLSVFWITERLLGA